MRLPNLGKGYLFMGTKKNMCTQVAYNVDPRGGVIHYSTNYFHALFPVIIPVFFLQQTQSTLQTIQGLWEKKGRKRSKQDLEEREVLWPLDLKVHTLVTDPLCRERGAPATVPLVLRSYTSQRARDPLEAGCSESNGWRRGPCRDMLGTICARNSWVSGTQNKVYKGRGRLQVDISLSLHGFLRQWEAKGEPWGREGSSCQDLRVLLLLQWEFPAGTIIMTATTVYTFV